MTTRSFRRVVRLSFGPPLAPGEKPDTGLLTEGYDVSDLRTTFEIRLGGDQDASPSNVRIYNLSDATAETLTAGRPIQVEAGYGTPDELLFVGRVRTSRHERDQLDRVTEMFLGPLGERAGDAFFKLPHDDAATIRDAVLLMGDAIGLPLDPISLGLVPDIPLVDTYADSGSPKDVLSRLLESLTPKVEHFENYGVIRLRLKDASGDGIATAPAAYIAESTSMIGSPSYTQEDADVGIRVRTVLTSALRVGDVVQVESGLTTGRFTIDSITHVGDTWGGDWHSEIEATELLDGGGDGEDE